jgi:beta-glucanase (GH16 family)
MRTPLALAFGSILVAAASGFPQGRGKGLPSEWTLTWSDEFSEPEGSSPDSGKWTYDLGGAGWGNHELESYTSRTENARVSGGNLVITAQQENYAGADGIPRPYTSARLKTQGKFAQAYGRFEARIRIPRGQGIWPGFWLLGEDIDRVDWPNCGEIDIMENIGREPGAVYGSLHAPAFAKITSDASQGAWLPEGQSYADAFHVYAVEWEPAAVRFFVDSRNYATFTRAEWPKGGQWVFDHPFFIILNVAVGGDWPGNPDAPSQFPQRMLVDYVRVYEKRSPPKREGTSPPRPGLREKAEP